MARFSPWFRAILNSSLLVSNLSHNQIIDAGNLYPTYKCDQSSFGRTNQNQDEGREDCHRQTTRTLPSYFLGV